MEIMKFVVLSLMFMSSCFAIENQTTNLEHQLKIQKREKQYLIEDDPYEGPEQKREERQSSLGKSNSSELKIEPKPLKVRLQPKVLTTPLKPIIKHTARSNPINIRIDTTPQRIPTKIPIILKTAKIIPAPAHALRLRMMANEKNDSIANKDIDLNTKVNELTSNKEDQAIPFKDDLIPFTIEDKVTPKSESRVNPNKEVDVISNQESRESLYKEDKVNKSKQASLSKDDQATLSRDGKVDLNEENIVSKPNTIVETNINKGIVETPLKANLKPIRFFIDEVDPLPAIKKQPTLEIQALKNKELLPGKANEIPKEKINKLRTNEAKYKDNVEQLDNEPNIVQISNGTHIISIKKIANDNKYKMQRLPTRKNFEESRLGVEERIVNERPSTTPSPIIDEPEQNPSASTEESVVLAGIALSDNNKKKEDQNSKFKNPDVKGQNDCITITNHDYTEFEERTTIPPPAMTTISTYNDGSQEPWKYQHPLQNFYYNPYYRNIYDQYKKYYEALQIDPNIYNQDINQPYVHNSEFAQPYYPVENQPKQNDDDVYCGQSSEKEPYLSPELRTENTLERIWRAWKDVEIKVRKSQSNDEPVPIDIRRNLVDHESNLNNGEVIAKVPIPYATQPIGLNGYYNNQNNPLIYPYMNPTYRYMR